MNYNTTPLQPRQAGLHLWALGANVVSIPAGGKDPAHEWNNRHAPWATERQDREIVESLPWNTTRRVYRGRVFPPIATVGIINGGATDWRSLDIDAVKHDDGTRQPVPRAVVLAVLAALELPEDYLWYGRSRSGAGWHVWLRCGDNLPADLDQVRTSSTARGVTEGRPTDAYAGMFDHLELRWERCQTTLPAPHGYGDHLPDTPPALVSGAQVAAAFLAIASPHQPPPPTTTAPVPPASECSSTPASSLREQRWREAWRDRLVETAVEMVRTPGAYGKAGHHMARLAAGRLLGGLIPHGLMSAAEIEHELIQAKPPEANEATERQALQDGIAAGMADPLTPPPLPATRHPAVDQTGARCCPTCGKRLLPAKNGNGWRCLTDSGDLCFWWAGPDDAATGNGHAGGNVYPSPSLCTDTVSPESADTEPQLTVEVLLAQIEQRGTSAERRLVLLEHTTAAARVFDHLALARLRLALETYDLTKTDIQQWLDLVRTEQRIQGNTGSVSLTRAADGDTLEQRPLIDIAQMDLPLLSAQVVDVMLAANAHEPTWFRWGQRIARLTSDEAGQPRIERLDHQELRSALARLCRFARISKEHVTACVPPDELITDLHTCLDRRLPHLERVVHAPIFTADGTLIQEPGYHPDAGISYLPIPDLVIPRVADTPTHAEMEQARSLIIDDLLVDFPLHDDASRAHALCLLLERFVRAMIDGPTPLYAIDAPSQGSGKGLLMQVLLLPMLGRHGTSTLAHTQYDEEWRKRLTTVLLDQPEVVAIDNVTGVFESAALASAITTPVWHDRLLGANQAVRQPVSCTWVANGNNLLLGGDMARRGIPIRLVPNVPRPSQRIGFKHRLPHWAHEHRGMLIWAACTLIRYGLQHGRPGRSLGTFEAWADLMGTILNGCDIPGLLDHLHTGTGQADPIAEQWQATITAWWDTRGSALTTTSDLYDMLRAQGIDLPDCVRGDTDENRRISLGKHLHRIRDRVFLVARGDAGYQRVQVRHADKSRTGASQWQLVDISPTNGGGVPMPDPALPGAPTDGTPRSHTNGRRPAAEGTGGADGVVSQPSAGYSASQCESRGLQRVNPMSHARVSPHHIPPDTTVAPAASPSTLCNPLPAHQHGQEAAAALSAAPDTPSAVPPAAPAVPAPPGMEAAPAQEEHPPPEQAALAAGHDAEARATAQQITDAPTRQHTLAEVTAALSHPDSVDRPRHIRQAHAWQSYQQAAALSAGIVRLTGAAPAALRGASLDAFAENELLALVRALRNELIALGWSPP